MSQVPPNNETGAVDLRAECLTSPGSDGRRRVVAYSAPQCLPPHTCGIGVVALATWLAMITHLDRACIATLAPGIMRDLGLTTVQMGYVFTVFQLAYALFEIPTARWADRMGTRLVLSRIVLWWSCLTAATGAATSYVTLLGHPVPLRRRGGGRVGLRRADLLPLDSRARARHGPGHLLRGRTPGRRPHPGAGAVDAPRSYPGDRSSCGSAH